MTGWAEFPDEGDDLGHDVAPGPCVRMSSTDILAEKIHEHSRWCRNFGITGHVDRNFIYGICTNCNGIIETYGRQ